MLNDAQFDVDTSEEEFCALALLELANGPAYVEEDSHISVYKENFSGHNPEVPHYDVLKRIYMDHNYFDIKSGGKSFGDHVADSGYASSNSTSESDRFSTGTDGSGATAPIHVMKTPRTRRVVVTSTATYRNAQGVKNIGSSKDTSYNVSTVYSDKKIGNKNNKTEFRCQKCPKLFAKECFLMKHMQQKHPSGVGGRKKDLMMCSSCGRNIPKTVFSRHVALCQSNEKRGKKQPEVDLASCQFCCVRMRRHLLVKHLAKEHCVDKKAPRLKEDEETVSYESVTEEQNNNNILTSSPHCPITIATTAAESHGFVSHNGAFVVKDNRPKLVVRTTRDGMVIEDSVRFSHLENEAADNTDIIAAAATAADIDINDFNDDDDDNDDDESLNLTLLNEEVSLQYADSYNSNKLIDQATV